MTNNSQKVKETEGSKDSVQDLQKKLNEESDRRKKLEKAFLLERDRNGQLAKQLQTEREEKANLLRTIGRLEYQLTTSSKIGVI